MKPSNDPKADKLVNSNISQPNDEMDENVANEEIYEKGGELQNG